MSDTPADATPEDAPTTRTTLEWVEQPTIADGRVVYCYRNIGDADATFVGEMVTAIPTAGATAAQTYQLEALAIGAEQRTHAPLGDLADGPVHVIVHVQATSNQEQLDSELEAELDGVIVAGSLLPPGSTGMSGDGSSATLLATISHLTIDGSDVVAAYSISGNATVAMLSGFVSLDHGGDSRWMGAAPLDAKDRDDMTRVGVPFDLVDGDGWSFRFSLAAVNEDQSAVTSATAIQPVKLGDGGQVEADGPWFPLEAT